jgi:predicted short-subunit dehydrogenase-like oxidoreductase (DUF2520 family)
VGLVKLGNECHFISQFPTPESNQFTNPKSNQSQMYKIALIGSGNVGYHLVNRFQERKVRVLQVFTRDIAKAQSISASTNVPYITDLQALTQEADCYIIAVKDDSIAAVAEKMSHVLPKNVLVVHTSGGTPSMILAPFFERFGSFYPFQTFSIQKKPNFSTIPICIDAAYEADILFLTKLAKKISPKVHHITDAQRGILHVAAVFVNNFTNHLFAIGEAIATKNDLPFDLLKPLILETVEKITIHSPKTVQTGPAIRGDAKTIQRHLDFLEGNHADFVDVYKVLTDSIRENAINRV